MEREALFLEKLPFPLQERYRGLLFYFKKIDKKAGSYGFNASLVLLRFGVRCVSSATEPLTGHRPHSSQAAAVCPCC